MTRPTAYALPAQRLTASGAVRRVGVELEFAGLEFRHSVAVVERVLGCPARIDSQAEAVVTHPGLGEFVVEVDSALAKSLAQKRAQWRLEANTEARQERTHEEDPFAEWLVNLTTELVPVELVCPPIDMDQLAVLDPLVDALRTAGALGTSESLLYAFGVHLNPELPALDALTISRYLRAYALAQDWLLSAHEVDLSRRITPYIDLYDRAYRNTVLAYDDGVSLEQIIDDYLRCNPTRNRALDLLPLFQYLDADRVNAALEDPRIKARPTFHYRMPNCEINRPGWHLAQCWNPWCVVERLAHEPDLLWTLSEDYQRHDATLIRVGTPPWHRQLEQLLRDPASA